MKVEFINKTTNSDDELPANVKAAEKKAIEEQAAKKADLDKRRAIAIKKYPELEGLI